MISEIDRKHDIVIAIPKYGAIQELTHETASFSLVWLPTTCILSLLRGGNCKIPRVNDALINIKYLQHLV